MRFPESTSNSRPHGCRDRERDREKVSTTLVPELEFKRWKKNGLSLLSYLAGLTFSPKHSRLFITDRLLHAVFIIDMHCPANVTFIASGGELGHTNGSWSKARFKNPAGVAVREEELYVCDQMNGTIRAVNMRSLFFHASRIGQEDSDAEESQSEEEGFAMRRIHKESVHILPLFQKKMYLIWYRLLPYVQPQRKTLNFMYQISALTRFSRLPMLWRKLYSINFVSLTWTRDEQHLLVGDRNGSNVHVCQVRGGLKTKTISNIPGPTGIAITESGTVFVSSSKEHSLFSLKEGDLFRGTENIHKVSGGSVGHCDGIKSRRNMPASLFAYRQDANDQKTHDQSTSSPEED